MGLTGLYLSRLFFEILSVEILSFTFSESLVFDVALWKTGIFLISREGECALIPPVFLTESSLFLGSFSGGLGLYPANL